jgi:sporulation integral membrane protein YlbJ
MTIFVKKAQTFSLKSMRKAIAVISALKAAAPLLFTLCGMALLLAYPAAAMQSVTRGLALWFNAVLPALFPFFFLSLILSKSQTLRHVEGFLFPVTEKLFRLPPRVGVIFITALLSGYPVGAKLIETAVCAGDLTAEEGRRASAFCIVSGPLFLMGTVGLTMFQSLAAGRILLVAHLASALFVGVFTGRFSLGKKSKLNAAQEGNMRHRSLVKNAKTATRLAKTEPTPVYEATISMLTMGGTIALFTVFLDLAIEVGLLNFILFPLRLIFGENDLMRAAAVGVVEVTRGCVEVAAIGVFPLSVATACALLSFGGLSVLMQAKIFLSRAQIKIKTCILGKGMQAIVAFFIAYALSVLFL